jgi:hypothetical protein
MIETKNNKKGNVMNNIVVRIEKSGNRFNAYDANGTKYTSQITTGARKKAFNNNMALEQRVNKSGKNYWWSVPMDMYEATTRPVVPTSSVEVPAGHDEVVNFIHSSYSLKPQGLMMNELKWKYLIRSAVRGKNILMTGPAGCGKTMRDEMSRAHPDAWNILMTVLDQGQRYLRLDEQDGQATINVAEGVTFVATANIGNEYTSTRVMDKALMDRFTIVEMDVLDNVQELELLQYMFPNVDVDSLSAIAEIANTTRVESSSETGKIDSAISTRTSVEMAGLMFDGFQLDEAAQVSVYPQFSNDGGVDSERTFVKQLVQKYINDGTTDDLFNEDELDDEYDSDY